MRKLIAFFALSALAAPGFAQMQMPKEAPGKADPKRVTAGTYALEPDHTLVEWEVNHLGFNNYIGLFQASAGSLILDPAKPENDTVSIEIPMNGVTTTNAKLTGELISPMFFDAATHPKARFTSTKVVVKGINAQIFGTLMLHGVTKPIVLAAKFTGAGNNFMMHKDTIGFSATTTIKRSDFGIMTFLPLVSDDVTLHISAAFVK